MTKDELLRAILPQNNSDYCRSILESFHAKIFEEASKGKGSMVVTIPYSESTELYVFHTLAQEGYQIEYVNDLPIQIRISWL